MGFKKTKRILLVAVAAIMIIFLWAKVFSMPDIPMPILQGAIFTVIILFLTWAGLGFPGKKKPMSAEEIVEHLTSVGFKANYIKAMEKSQPPRAVKFTLYEKDGVDCEISVFTSLSDAMNYYDSVRFTLANTGDGFISESKMDSKDYCKYALKTQYSYNSLLWINETVIHMSSDTEKSDDVDKFFKDFRY